MSTTVVFETESRRGHHYGDGSRPPGHLWYGRKCGTGVHRFFSARVKEGGLLLSKYGLKRGGELKAGNHKTYHLQEAAADVHAADIRVNSGSYTFHVVATEWTLTDVALNMGGMHNIENMVAAITVAKHLGIDDEKIRSAAGSFKRREAPVSEFIVKKDDRVFIDDYCAPPGWCGP